MIFAGMSERSSGQIRGIQISDRISSLGFYSKFFDIRDENLLSIKDQTVVFIRNFDKKIANRMKQQGCKIVFDTLDRPVADIHQCQRDGSRFSWSSYSIPEVDEFIVNNSLVADQISSVSRKRCVVIPHHSVDHRPLERKTIKTAGYVGLPDQIESQKELESLLGRFGIRFSSTNPLTRQDCVRSLECLDLGIIFLRNNERTDPVLKYKPNTKLTNFQSFGIPTIAVPYQSFVEFGSDAWINSSESSFMSDLENLLKENSTEKIKELSIRSIENSKNYTLDRVCETYLRIDEK